jgi:hypothetical protein
MHGIREEQEVLRPESPLYNDARHWAALEVHLNDRIEAFMYAIVSGELLAPDLVLRETHHTPHRPKETVDDC